MQNTTQRSVALWPISQHITSPPTRNNAFLGKCYSFLLELYKLPHGRDCCLLSPTHSTTLSGPLAQNLWVPISLMGCHKFSSVSLRKTRCWPEPFTLPTRWQSEPDQDRGSGSDLWSRPELLTELACSSRLVRISRSSRLCWKWSEVKGDRSRRGLNCSMNISISLPFYLF